MSFNADSTTTTTTTGLVHLRTFSHPWKGENKKEHSFYVGHEAGGLSESLDVLTIDFTGTFSRLRQQIEEQSAGNVMRRRPFYTEFLAFMQRCPNPLGYEGEQLLTYRVGVLKNNNDCKGGFAPSMRNIKLIREDVEAITQICEVIDQPLGTDVVLVPTTQIHPTTDRLADQL